jgi:hypothetical protein
MPLPLLLPSKALFAAVGPARQSVREKFPILPQPHTLSRRSPRVRAPLRQAFPNTTHCSPAKSTPQAATAAVPGEPRSIGTRCICT